MSNLDNNLRNRSKVVSHSDKNTQSLSPEKKGKSSRSELNSKKTHRKIKTESSTISLNEIRNRHSSIVSNNNGSIDQLISSRRTSTNISTNQNSVIELSSDNINPDTANIEEFINNSPSLQNLRRNSISEEIKNNESDTADESTDIEEDDEKAELLSDKTKTKELNNLNDDTIINMPFKNKHVAKVFHDTGKQRELLQERIAPFQKFKTSYNCKEDLPKNFTDVGNVYKQIFSHYETEAELFTSRLQNQIDKLNNIIKSNNKKMAGVGRFANGPMSERDKEEWIKFCKKNFKLVGNRVPPPKTVLKSLAALNEKYEGIIKNENIRLEQCYSNAIISMLVDILAVSRNPAFVEARLKDLPSCELGSGIVSDTLKGGTTSLLSFGIKQYLEYIATKITDEPNKYLKYTTGIFAAVLHDFGGIVSKTIIPGSKLSKDLNSSWYLSAMAERFVKQDLTLIVSFATSYFLHGFFEQQGAGKNNDIGERTFWVRGSASTTGGLITAFLFTIYSHYCHKQNINSLTDPSTKNGKESHNTSSHRILDHIKTMSLDNQIKKIESDSKVTTTAIKVLSAIYGSYLGIKYFDGLKTVIEENETLLTQSLKYGANYAISILLFLGGWNILKPIANSLNIKLKMDQSFENNVDRVIEELFGNNRDLAKKRALFKMVEERSSEISESISNLPTREQLELTTNRITFTDHFDDSSIIEINEEEYESNEDIIKTNDRSNINSSTQIELVQYENKNNESIEIVISNDKGDDGNQQNDKDSDIEKLISTSVFRHNSYISLINTPEVSEYVARKLNISVHKLNRMSDTIKKDIESLDNPENNAFLYLTYDHYSSLNIA